jgi:hypothetical protein
VRLWFLIEARPRRRAAIGRVQLRQDGDQIADLGESLGPLLAGFHRIAAGASFEHIAALKAGICRHGFDFEAWQVLAPRLDHATAKKCC